MKTITHDSKQKNRGFFWLFFSFAVVSFGSSFAQVQNNGTLFISNGASVFVQSDAFTFGTGSTTETGRGTTFGKLIFSATATTSGAVTGGTLFTNGYASTLSTAFFLLPVGQTNVYAPVGVDNASVTTTVGNHAAFFSAAPTNAANLDATVEALPSSGYWDIEGDAAKISLTWSTSLSSLIPNTTVLTIAGYKISSSKWEAITSVVDVNSVAGGTSSMASGSITSSSAVDLTLYSAFSLARLGVDCAPAVTQSATPRTWNGSWDFIPTINDAVTIASAGSPGSFACYSLALNADVTLTGTETIEIATTVSGSGKIIMSSQASLVQRATGVAGPNIELTKTTNLMRQYDYIYWGVPVIENIFSQLNNAIATGGAAGAFDLKYKYVSGSDAGGWQPLTETELGKGFIARVKPVAPFTSTSATATINLKFSGVANNGTITFPAAYGTVSNAYRNNQLLGNPYPSAIDADKFLLENSSVIDGFLLIWKAQILNDGAGQAYTAADYITYTRAGTVSTGSGAASFSGKIATGQGFKVRALATGTIEFNNCMRLTTDNTQFNKSASTVETPKDRYKLNLTKEGVFSQILVSYLPETTLAYDHMYDAERSSVSASQLYSILDNDTKKLAINARPAFETTDVVTLGVSKTGTASENFSVAIAEKEGVFATNAVNVFLYDTVLNVYHNLANGAYTFNTNSVEMNNRFQVVYQDGTLSNIDFESNNVIATISNQNLQIVASLPMTEVAIYDIAGRLVTAFTLNNDVELTKPFRFSEGIYIVKIKMNNGAIATQKLINKK